MSMRYEEFDSRLSMTDAAEMILDDGPGLYGRSDFTTQDFLESLGPMGISWALAGDLIGSSVALAESGLKITEILDNLRWHDAMLNRRGLASLKSGDLLMWLTEESFGVEPFGTVHFDFIRNPEDHRSYRIVIPASLTVLSARALSEISHRHWRRGDLVADEGKLLVTWNSYVSVNGGGGDKVGSLLGFIRESLVSKVEIDVTHRLKVLTEGLYLVRHNQGVGSASFQQVQCGPESHLLVEANEKLERLAQIGPLHGLANLSS